MACGDGKLCQRGSLLTGMTTMNVSLPEELKAFVDAQAERGGYGSTSEFVRDLIRREQDR